MYLCVCAREHVIYTHHMYIHTYANIYTHMHESGSALVCIYLSIHLSSYYLASYLPVYLSIDLSICLYMLAYRRPCTCSVAGCIYTHLHIGLYVLYIYIHTYVVVSTHARTDLVFMPAQAVLGTSPPSAAGSCKTDTCRAVRLQSAYGLYKIVCGVDARKDG